MGATRAAGVPRRRHRQGVTAGRVPPFLVGILVAISVLAAALVNGGWNPPSAEPGHLVSPGDNNTASCLSAPATGCILVPAGETWATGPPSTWCTFNTTVQHGSNGSYNSTMVRCASSAVTLVFNATQPSVLAGTIYVNGPYQLWLLPSADGCFLFGELAHVALPCPVPAGPTPEYPWWNQTYPAARATNLSALTFDLGGAPDLVPPAVWAFEVVDLGNQVETVTAVSDLTVSPL